MPVTIGGSGPITGVTSINTTVSDTELGYLDGVTSALQTQINAKAADSSQGLYLITSQSFSAASSVSVNNCFSTTYSQYLIMRTLLGSVIDQNINVRLRVAGTDDSGTNYRRQVLSADSTTVAGVRATGETSWVSALSYTETVAIGVAQLWVSNPFDAARTTAYGVAGYDHDANIAIYQRVMAHDLATSYDGFSFYPSSGTITGTIRVYGLKN